MQEAFPSHCKEHPCYKYRRNTAKNSMCVTFTDLIKSVVVTSKMDKLTVTAASKKKGLKKDVA